MPNHCTKSNYFVAEFEILDNGYFNLAGIQTYAGLHGHGRVVDDNTIRMRETTKREGLETNIFSTFKRSSQSKYSTRQDFIAGLLTSAESFLFGENANFQAKTSDENNVNDAHSATQAYITVDGRIAHVNGSFGGLGTIGTYDAFFAIQDNLAVYRYARSVGQNDFVRMRFQDNSPQNASAWAVFANTGYMVVTVPAPANNDIWWTRYEIEKLGENHYALKMITHSAGNYHETSKYTFKNGRLVSYFFNKTYYSGEFWKRDVAILYSGFTLALPD
jgi:hypothetical protein